MGDVLPLHGAEVSSVQGWLGKKGPHVLVPLSLAMVRELDAICAEGYTAAGYLRFLPEQDLQARKDSGWTVSTGWQRPQRNERG